MHYASLAYGEWTPMIAISVCLPLSLYFSPCAALPLLLYLALLLTPSLCLSLSVSVWCLLQSSYSPSDDADDADGGDVLLSL